MLTAEERTAQQSMPADAADAARLVSDGSLPAGTKGPVNAGAVKSQPGAVVAKGTENTRG
ncbi:hypothetical protein AB0E69_15440 [Kribbella sp. NPDC026611]|uniref:hypothetical protein n=1 Tax=Kribbella sp. NPDC026611 TaxID=3154911 RepID=UPI0033EE3431